MAVGMIWTNAFLKLSAGNSLSHDTKYLSFWYMVYCSSSKISLQKCLGCKIWAQITGGSYPKDNWLVCPWHWHVTGQKIFLFLFSCTVFYFLLDNAYNTFRTKTWASFNRQLPCVHLPGCKNQNNLLMQLEVLLPTDCVSDIWPCF